jgi:hypothetical protein
MADNRGPRTCGSWACSPPIGLALDSGSPRSSIDLDRASDCGRYRWQQCGCREGVLVPRPAAVLLPNDLDLADLARRAEALRDNDSSDTPTLRLLDGTG